MVDGINFIFLYIPFVMVCESVVVLDLGLLASRSDFEYSSNCVFMHFLVWNSRCGCK